MFQHVGECAFQCPYAERLTDYPRVQTERKHSAVTHRRFRVESFELISQLLKILRLTVMGVAEDELVIDFVRVR